MKKCPYCAEDIQDDAKKCKHCGEWLSDNKKIEPIKEVKNQTTILPKNEKIKSNLGQLFKVFLGIIWIIFILNSADFGNPNYTRSVGYTIGYNIAIFGLAFLGLLLIRSAITKWKK